MLTQNTALEGISDSKNVKEQIEIIVSERNKLIKTLNNFPFVKTVFPTDSNFILCRVDDANRRYKELMDRGIIVRNRHGQPLCENCLRISVGTPEENLKLIDALKTL